MKNYIMELTFQWDEENDTKQVVIETPDDVSVDVVTDALNKGHEYLCFEDEEDRYGNDGREPETLVGYVCRKYGWKWRRLGFDTCLIFD